MRSYHTRPLCGLRAALLDAIAPGPQGGLRRAMVRHRPRQPQPAPAPAAADAAARAHRLAARVDCRALAANRGAAQ